MQLYKDKKSLMIPMAVGVFEFVLLFFVIYYIYHSNMLISINRVAWDNIIIKFIGDYCAMLLIPTIIIIINRKHLSNFRLHFKGQKEVFLLLAIMIVLFLLHKDFTITGIYRFFFYLVVVAFGEEFIYRGYMYNRLKVNSEVLAIVLSGILWGISHAILPSIISNADLGKMILSMMSEVGGKILMGWYFIYLQEKSKTIWVPILIHAILDYAVSYIGIITAIVIFIYFRSKSRGQKIVMSKFFGKKE